MRKRRDGPIGEGRSRACSPLTPSLAVKMWAFNQGFYNLFLAAGGFYGLYLRSIGPLSSSSSLLLKSLVFPCSEGSLPFWKSDLLDSLTTPPSERWLDLPEKAGGPSGSHRWLC